MKDFHHIGTIAVIVFGVTGALMLWFFSFSPWSDAQPHSLAVLAFRVWIVVGAIFWAWYFREEKKREFIVHLELRARFDDEVASWFAPGKTPTALLAIGNQAFGARLRRVDDATPGAIGTASKDALRLAVQLQTPATALAALPVGAEPRVMIDGGPAGTGEVLRVTTIVSI